MEEPGLIRKMSLTDKLANKQKKYLIIAIFCVITIFIGSSYALLTNFKKSGELITIKTGNLTMNITNTLITLSDKLPENDTNGLTNSTPVEILLTNSGTIDIMKYEVKLVKDSTKTSTLDNQYIKYAISLDGTNYGTPKKLSDTNVIYTGYNLAVNQSKTIYLKVWIAEDAGNNALGKTFYGSVDVELYQKADLPGSMKVLDAASARATEASCATTTTEDGITYISGTKDCINFNYVWYSGKMWRITAIYPDGKMKLVTDNNITSIAFGSNVTYYNKSTGAKSYMYQWLNEDFLDTLYNYENIIVHDENTYWNATKPSSTTIGTKPAETEATMIPTSISPVGLLNSYEYYMSYKVNGTSATVYGNGYLNIGYYWWLLNPRDNCYDYFVTQEGNLSQNAGGFYSTSSFFLISRSVRPSIILQSNISFTGSGTKNDPYKIVGDLSSPTLGTTKVNERVYEKNNITYSYNGEYVKIKYDNELSPLYRIVGVEVDPNDNTKTITKLVAMDYADNKAKKKFATDNTGTIYGSGKTIDSGKTTWYSYLNGTGSNDGWFDNLSYKSLLTSGRYYMGNGDSTPNYKDAICATADISSPTRTCTQTSNTGTFNVGLLRYGEMFATQQAGGSSNSIQMWLITGYSSSRMHFSDEGGSGGSFDGCNPNISLGARPTIYLKSDVKFLTCSSSKCDGTEDYPYEVGL